jgi:NADPH-dependent 2,4-dienoyl-CoA reductase/sulfur reductase-like enzyme/rhodanese-related sulfurtransferase
MEKAEGIVIIGGVAAGAAAATRARRINENAKITIFERTPYVSFANCGMPYYIGGEISDRQKLLLNSPEFFKKRFNIDVFINHEAVSINRKNNTITVKDLKSGKESKVRYDKLLIATGAYHIVPGIEGIDAKNVFPLRHIAHMDMIKDYMDTSLPKKAVVLGGGYIGLEVAEQLKNAGISVTVVEKADQILLPLDPEMASIVEEHMISSGINIIKEDGVTAILKEGELAEKVRLSSGRELESDLILLSVGIRPDVTLAKDAGLEIGGTGAICVDDRMMTSDKSIFAAGDAVESVHKVTGKKVWIALAGAAGFQGRVAGTVMAGGDAGFSGVLGTAIVRVNKITAANTGLNEKQALKEGLKFFVSYSHSPDHAGYYPGAAIQHIKLVAEEKTGKLLGAQVVGYNGVDKTIDLFAAAINFGRTVDDLVDLDIAYAPPFSSAKSPVQMAGMIAQNRIRGIDDFIDAGEVMEKGYEVIDVRTVLEHQRDIIFEGSESIPIDTLRDNIPLDKKDKKIALLCRAGLRSYLGYRILKQSGFKDVKNINGGFLISRHILKRS